MQDLSEQSSTHPYAGLTPDRVLNAVESLGYRADGRLLALNSYENRVYQIGMEEGPPVVVKFYRPGRWTDEQILEEHGFLREIALQEIPAVPACERDGVTLHRYEGYRFAVFTRRGGHAPPLDDPAALERIGRFIGRIHAVGATQAFATRPVLDAASFGDASRDYLLDQGFLPPDLLDAYRSVSAQALDGVRRCIDRAGDVSVLRLHGDCHPGNILWTDAGPHFVDFDDSRTGPAVQDLWMLLSGERREMVSQLSDLLAGYEEFAEFRTNELYLVEGLRTLRLLHYAAWIARRWDDPAFPVAFPWFNTARYWQDRILELREQIALMDEPPLWSA